MTNPDEAILIVTALWIKKFNRWFIRPNSLRFLKPNSVLLVILLVFNFVPSVLHERQ
jgi:hypothetical protein